MALPHRRQQLAKFIPFHDFTPASFAAEVSSFLSEPEVLERWDILNISYGRKYPTAREIRAIELAMGGIPAPVVLEDSLLKNYDRDLRLECES